MKETRGHTVAEPTPAITEAINGVWETHQGLEEDRVVSVLREAVRSSGHELDDDEYERIGRQISDGTWR